MQRFILRLAGWLEGLMILAVGLYMLTLSTSDFYWTLFNPKFRWLTMLGGFTASLSGLALFFAPAEKPKPTRLASFAFLLYILASYQPQDGLVDNSPAGQRVSSGFTGGLTGEMPSQGSQSGGGPSRETVDGVEYVRLNVAELLFLMGGQGQTPLDTPFTTRGVVRRTPQLDAQNEIVLSRIAVVCCLADAVEVGVRVRVDDPTAYADGTWYKVRGSLLDQPLPDKSLSRFQSTAGVMAITEARYLLAPKTLEPTDPPGLPYVFDIRTKEPFAY